MAEFPSQGCLDLLEYLAESDGGYQDFAETVGENGIGPDFLAHLIRGRKRPSVQTAGDIERATDGQVLTVTWSVQVPTSRVQKAVVTAKKIAADKRAAAAAAAS